MSTLFSLEPPIRISRRPSTNDHFHRFLSHYISLLRIFHYQGEAPTFGMTFVVANRPPSHWLRYRPHPRSTPNDRVGRRRERSIKITVDAVHFPSTVVGLPIWIVILPTVIISPRTSSTSTKRFVSSLLFLLEQHVHQHVRYTGRKERIEECIDESGDDER